MQSGLPGEPDPTPTAGQYQAAAVGLAAAAACLLFLGLTGWLGWATLRGHVVLSVLVAGGALICWRAARR